MWSFANHFWHKLNWRYKIYLMLDLISVTGSLMSAYSGFDAACFQMIAWCFLYGVPNLVPVFIIASTDLNEVASLTQTLTEFLFWPKPWSNPSLGPSLNHSLQHSATVFFVQQLFNGLGRDRQMMASCPQRRQIRYKHVICYFIVVFTCFCCRIVQH